MRIFVFAECLVKLLQYVERVVPIFNLLTSLRCKFSVDILEVVCQVEVR